MLKLNKTLILLVIFTQTSFAQSKLHSLPETSVAFDSSGFAKTKRFLDQLSTNDFTKETFDTGNEQIPYRLLKPQHLVNHVKYPLIITLHNSTRMGTDNERQLEALTRIWLIPENRKKFPAFVLAPQFEKRSSMYELDRQKNILISKPSPALKQMPALIAKLIQEYDIDPKRIYLIGYSMGGSSAQNLMALNPDLFTAMISIAGVPDFSNISKIKKKPIWLIHGRKDEENLFKGSEELYRSIPKQSRIKLSSYDNLDHSNINYPLLLSKDLPIWLFRWKK